MKSIKYILLDYAIEAFFDKVLVNFSNFDILGGCREFDIIQIISYRRDSHTTTMSIYEKCKITSIREDQFGMIVEFDWSFYGNKRFAMRRITRVKSCDNGILVAESRP